MEIVSKKSTKNLIVDHLSRLKTNAIVEEGEIIEVFLNEQLLAM